MDINKEKKYTLEFNEVLEYMSKTLANEFPTDILTPEYLILSILDTRNCHANLILDNCLMSNNLEDLKKTYVAAIESHRRPQLKGQSVVYGDELVRLINCADEERKGLKNDEMGTEHILLAVLNRKNNFKNFEVFEKFRLEYDFIRNKCGSSAKAPQKLPKPIKPKTNQIPLKSQVNAKQIPSIMTDFISKYTISINKLAKNGEIDTIVGRERETKEIIKTLARRKKNNAILVGNGGCGKTAIVYNLANLIETGKVPSILDGKEIVLLNIMALVSGTHFRGMFEERVNGLFTELQSSDKYILFIDDIQNVLKNGSKDKDTDISGMISNVLSEGKLKVICTTTFRDYRTAVESNTAISRKLQKIVIEPNTVEESIKILTENKKFYEDFHKVRYGEKAIKKAVELANRYVTDRCLPDSAFDIIDMAGAETSLMDRWPIEIQNLKKRMREIEVEKYNALNDGNFEIIDSLTIEENAIASDIADYKRDIKNLDMEVIDITEENIADIVSEMTKIPVSKLSTNEKTKIANIDKTLKESVIGQDEAIESICRVIKRNKVGLGNGNQCSGAFLLCGKTGVGKTFFAKKLAEEIFGDENALIRLDMSEYSEKNSISKLHGSSPGYVGYDDGGVLTNAIKRKPYSVVLLDEIEKADESIYNLFLQIFDDGRISESNGNLVDCHNCIFIMTSNIGAKKAAELGNGVGFVNSENDNKKSIINKELKRKFTPEFLNRLDQIVYFNNLTDENLKNIVKLEINKLNKRLNNIEYSITYTDDVVTHIHTEALKSKEFGARPIVRLIHSELEDRITDLMLVNDYPPNYVFSASCSGDKIELN